MKILVADDSKTNLSLITSYLQKLGNEVLPVSSGEQAIEMYKSNKPDLIILDVVMEGMSGFETAKALRVLEGEEWIPIIFLSSQEDDESIAHGIDAGGDDYLIKPVTEVRLAAKVKAMQRISDMRQILFETTKKLSVLSSTDALTGVYNRFQFERSLKEKIAHTNRHQCLLALMFLDLDHFKIVNDTLGHQVGDSLLKEVANRLVFNLREDDFIARLGGDEFAIILGEVESMQAVGEIAKKIINALCLTYDLAGHDVHISASIGIVCYPLMGDNTETLVQNADVAMYHAKKLGRNNFQFFTDELNEKYQKRVYIEKALKFAIQRQQLFLTYQPIFQLQTKKIVGMEALVGWNHPKMGSIPPSIFIPIAEEENLIVDIGEWVLHESCKQLAKWYAMGHKSIKLAVNISSRQLIQKEFSMTIEDILNHTGLPAALLDLELTESSVMTNIGFSEDILKILAEIGVNISIDNFGTGFSSLIYLNQLPINTLKIDRSFTTDISMDPNHAIIIRSAIMLGNNMGLNVVASGIETEEQFKFLVENGCNQGQGFYLCRPLTIEQMTNFLDKVETIQAK